MRPGGACPGAGGHRSRRGRPGAGPRDRAEDGGARAPGGAGRKCKARSPPTTTPLPVLHPAEPYTRSAALCAARCLVCDVFRPPETSRHTAGAPQTLREGGDEPGRLARQDRAGAGRRGSPEAPRGPRLPGGGREQCRALATLRGKVQRRSQPAQAGAAAEAGGPRRWRGRSRRGERWGSGSARPTDVPLHPGHGFQGRGSWAGPSPGPSRPWPCPGSGPTATHLSRSDVQGRGGMGRVGMGAMGRAHVPPPVPTEPQLWAGEGRDPS